MAEKLAGSLKLTFERIVDRQLEMMARGRQRVERRQLTKVGGNIGLRKVPSQKLLDLPFGFVPGCLEQLAVIFGRKVGPQQVDRG